MTFTGPWLAQWVKLAPVILTSHTAVEVQGPATLHLLPLPADVLGETAEDGPKAWALAVHMGNQSNDAGFWRLPGAVRLLQPFEGMK